MKALSRRRGFEERGDLQSNWLSLLVLTFGLVVVCLQTWPILVKWWIGDDPAILNFAATHSVFQYFFSPESWRKFTPTNLTPMVLLSFKLDLAIFGLNPKPFYVHQMIVAVMASVLLFVVLLRYVGSPWAGVASISLMLSAPMASCISSLMTRHYLEGTAFSLLSLLFFDQYLEKKRSWKLIVSIISYALATLCKEVFVPLFAVLALWPCREKKDTWKVSSPFLLWVALYVAYRRWMLGRFMGGYGSTADPFMVKIMLGNMYKGIWGGDIELAAMYGFLAILLLVTVLRSVKDAAFLGVTVCCLLLPLLPISAAITERHLLVPSVALAGVIAFAINYLERLKKPFTTCVAVALSLLLIVFSLRVYHRSVLKCRAIAVPFAETGTFLWYKSVPKDVIVNPLIPGWYFNYLKELKEKILLKAPMGRGIVDLCYALELGGIKGDYRLWRYDSYAEKIKRIPKQRVKSLTDECLHLFRPVHLSAWIWEEDRAVHWRFGPYKNGLYFVVDKKTGFPFPLKREGFLPASLEDLSLKKEEGSVCYESPEGWRTCTTPVITKERPAALERKANR